MLFVLTAEPLDQAVKNYNGINVIAIPSSTSTSLICQYADDTGMTVTNK